MGKSYKASKRFQDDYEFYDDTAQRYNNKKAKDRRNEKKLKKKMRDQNLAFSDDGDDDSYL